MSNLLFDTLFHNHVENQPCLTSVDGSSINYQELYAETARVANVLTTLGVQPGDRVAAQIEKSAAAIALYLGVVRVGAVFLPLNTAYTTHEIEYFLGNAQPVLFVCHAGSDNKLRLVAHAAGARLETLDDSGKGGSWAEKLREVSEEFVTVARGPDDLAAILYTSGTTGRAKGAMITHRNLSSNATALAQYWHFTRDDVLLHVLPIFHTHGLFVAINTVMVSGASMLFVPRFSASEVMELLPRCSVMMGVPTFYTRLLALEGFNHDTVTHMRLFTSGSAPMTLETHKAFTERTGHVILERYGMTETNMNTSNPYDGERVPGSVGFPLPGVELRITDPSAANVCEMPSGKVGMIEVRGPNVFKGYWQMADKTAEEIRPDGFFISGDLGMIDAGDYVHIVGRDKDLIISGGYNVYPKEVEMQIDRLNGVAESAVIGVQHADFGEGVVAVVVPQPNAVIDVQTIIEALSGQLAKYKMPKQVFPVDELPRNAMGKVQKSELRERYKNAFS